MVTYETEIVPPEHDTFILIVDDVDAETIRRLMEGVDG
jgi:hypothetical protein